MHTNYYKIVKVLKSLKIIMVAPTCFGLRRPSTGSSLPVLRSIYDVDFGYISLHEVIGIVAAYAAQADDGLRKPEHVEVTIIILSDFNT